MSTTIHIGRHHFQLAADADIAKLQTDVQEAALSPGAYVAFPTGFGGKVSALIGPEVSVFFVTEDVGTAVLDDDYQPGYAFDDYGF